MQTVLLSPDRKITLPETICEAYRLTIGQTLEIELTSQGILLKTAPTFLKKITIDDVAGCLAYQGKPKTLEEMDKAIEEGIIAEWGNNDRH
jgi:bifunctional DNA-binding transcriptional regulator/antitoxin component of YhaV-PrlF toxin-antitoxin module